MDGAIFSLQGQEYHLALSAAILFDCYDRYGAADTVLDRITGESRESLEDTLWVLGKLSEQGAAVRRLRGMDPGPVLTEQEARLMLDPLDLIRARAAIRDAWAIGFHRDIQKTVQGHRDLGLEELQKKTAVCQAVQNFCTKLRRLLAMDPVKP